MKKLLPILLVSIGLAACKVEPEPIHYGVDGCHHCKMTLMDPRFGAEIVTEKGKIYKFDDVNCMMATLETDEVSYEKVKYFMVADYTQPETLIDANYAFYLKSEKIKSPMASHIGAFPDEPSMKEFQKNNNGGIYLAWGELVTQFK